MNSSRADDVGGIRTFTQTTFDPTRLLKQFSAHLNDSGGVIAGSIPQLIELMQNADSKLVPKCISLCIIGASHTDVQWSICDSKIWDILFKWLQDALMDEDQAFLLELLDLFLRLPVRVELLKRNGCPKAINSLAKAKTGHEGIKKLAVKIVHKWKGIISADSKSTEVPVSKQPVASKSNEQAVSEQVQSDKRRRRTAKVTPTTLRTAGVEDVPDIHPKARSDVLTKRKIDQDNSLSESSIESFHQRVSMSSDTKKVVELHESANFINALTTTPVVKKKRKLSLKPTDNSTPPDSAIIQGIPLPIVEPMTSSPKIESSFDNSTSVQSLDGTKKSSLSSLSSFNNKPKKRVSWAEDDKLTDFFYFELDETERVNVNRISLEDLRRKDMSLERQLLSRGHESDISSVQKWRTPQLLERTFIAEPGCYSLERQIQLERERDVLQAIYFTRDSIPPTPDEPDLEPQVEVKEPNEIPIDDLTRQTQDESPEASVQPNLLLVNDGQGASQISLNPEIANLVKSLAANITTTDDSASAVNNNSSSTNATSIDSTSNIPTPMVVSSASSEELATTPVHLSKQQSEDKEPASDDQSLQKELWEVLETNYSELNVRELTAERIRELLEPLRDQLCERGIVQTPSDAAPSGGNGMQPFSFPPPPFLQPTPTTTMNGGVPFPPGGPPGDGYPPMPPPHHQMQPPPHSMRPDFRPGPYRQLRPPYPPRFMRHPGPPARGGRGIPRGSGGGGPPRGRGQQPCRFFQQGTCRNGDSCSFAHIS